MVVWLPQNQNMNNFILMTKTQWRAYSFKCKISYLHSMMNEQLLRQVKCMCTEMYVQLQSNVPQQIWMYTYKDLCTQPTKLKFTDWNVHLKILCAFLILSWLNTRNKAAHPKKDECTLEIEYIYWPLTLGISISKICTEYFPLSHAKVIIFI